jgi:hypothetical protein
MVNPGQTVRGVHTFRDVRYISFHEMQVDDDSILVTATTTKHSEHGAVSAVFRGDRRVQMSYHQNDLPISN